MVAKTEGNPDTVKALNQNGINAVLYNYIVSVGGRIIVPIVDIAKTPKDSRFYSRTDEAGNVEIKVDMPVIAVPERRIIT